MGKRSSLLVMALGDLLMREAQAALAPDQIEAEKSAAPYPLTVQVEAVEWRLIPVSPHRTLPAPWHIEYAHHWGRMVFAFRMIEPHDYGDRLVEVLLRQDR